MIVIETKYSKRDNTLKIYYHSLVFRIIVSKELYFIKTYTIRVFLILLYYRIVSFIITVR